MGRILQKLYDICGAVAGGLIVWICLLISAQILLNGMGRLSPGQLPSTIPSYADFSGPMLAGATFLALAHTLRAGGHIRVNLVTARLPARAQVALEAFVLLASGVWVAISLCLVGLAALVFFSNALSGLTLATTFWGHSYSWALTALPLFILMGEILLRSRMSDDMFTGLVPWLSRAPGRLLHVNVVGCAILPLF